MKGNFIFYSIGIVFFIIYWKIYVYFIKFFPIVPLSNVLTIFFSIFVMIPLSLISSRKIIQIIKNTHIEN